MAHNLLRLSLIFCLSVSVFATGLRAPLPQAPVANAGPDRTVSVNEVVSLNGSASTGAVDGWLPNSDQHAIKWDFGYGGWTNMGSLIAPVAYPVAGVYPATVTICNAIGTICSSDTAMITVTAITEGAETVIGDSGNPVTNSINLCNAIQSLTSANNPVVTITAGVTYRRPPSSPCVLPNRTGSGYLTIRTSAHASLPNGTSRVFPADATNMAILEPGVHVNNPNINSNEPVFLATTGSNPAHHYRFLGLHVRKTFSTLEYTSRAFFDIGNGSPTSLAQLPHHFQIDRCYFDGGSTTSNTLRGVAIAASDISVVNSYLYRFKGVGLETQTVFVGMGERIALINNYHQAATEHVMFGGADPTINGHVPTDVFIARNWMQKDVCWFAGSACYYGVNFSVKNSLEFKIVNRAVVVGNRIEDHWQEDQNWSVTVTVRNQNGTAPWSDISFVDFAYNQIIKSGGAVQILGHDAPNVSGDLDHLIFRHVVFAGVSYYNGQHNTFTITAGDGAGPISAVRTSTDSNGFNGQGRWLEFDGSTGFVGCTFNGNVAQGHINFNGAIKGQAALQQACSGSSWQAVKNGFYLPDGTNPADNTTVATRADVRFTDIALFNLKLLDTSPFLTTGLGGGRSGADIDAVNTMTVGCQSGVWPGTGTINLRGRVTLGGKVN